MGTIMKRNSPTIHSFKLLLIALFLAVILFSSHTALAAIWYVNGDIGTSGDGTTWNNAYLTIQEAVSTASEGDEIWVTKGTYSLSSQINMDKAVGIYGGFTGSEIRRDQRDWATNITKIDGQGSVYHCFYVTADATIDGLTITGGNANGTGLDSSGGGVYNRESSPTITNCTFKDNNANENGGGIENYKSAPTINNCTFSANTAKWGGGIFNLNSSGTITSCAFTGNNATKSGGGMYNFGSSPPITNCTFTGNSAGTWGGGIYNATSSPTITNCTLFGNSATNYGGGIRNYQSSAPTITNCILWGNVATDDGPEIHNNDTSSPLVTYCNIQGGYEGQGNINSDPVFADPENGDFHLQVTSPCIDKGNNTASGITSTDFEGDARIVDGDNDSTATVDMGTDEYTDTDSDELPDYWERGYFCDLSQGSGDDYDGDGATNAEEYQAGTDPALKADGDVAPLGNKDCAVNVGDALVCLRFALGLEPGHPTTDEMCHGDVAPLDTENKPNPDGVINVGDALVILRKALGIVSF